MFVLTDFEKAKLKGILHLNKGEDLKAIDCFNAALAIKEEGFLYYQIARAYFYQRKYEKALEYAYTAVDKGYDCIQLIYSLLTANLNRPDLAIQYMNEGIKKQIPSAYLYKVSLFLRGDISEYDMGRKEIDELLKTAYELTPYEKKGKIAYDIASYYKNLYNSYEYLFSEFPSPEFEYLKIFDNYGGNSLPTAHQNYILFDAAVRSNDRSIIDVLFDRWDSDTNFIFSLLLLHEEIEKTGTINFKDNLAMFCAVDGSLENEHPGCKTLMALQFGSDFESCKYDRDGLDFFMTDLRGVKVETPASLEQFYEALMEHIFNKIDA